MDRVPDTLIVFQFIEKHHALYEIRKLQLCYKNPELVSVLSQLYPLLTFADNLCNVTVIWVMTPCSLIQVLQTFRRKGNSPLFNVLLAA
jgi:hypothetical protein